MEYHTIKWDYSFSENIIIYDMIPETMTFLQLSNDTSSTDIQLFSMIQGHPSMRSKSES